MIPVFSTAGLDAVREAARRPSLLAFDFDGTLAPIVDDRGAAALSEQTRSLLRASALLVPCAVISGRARADVAARLSGIPLRAIVGNHGAEPTAAEPPAGVRARVHAWAAALRSGVDHEGVEVEDKGFSIAVHVRRTPRPAEARERMARLAAALPGARVSGGIAVVNVVPAGAPTKGDAVESFAAMFPSAPLLYVGDDETDEDAFRSRAVTWGIRVGRSDPSAARFFLRDQTEVDALLRTLLLEHARHRGPRHSGG